jgi:hypothetical protein
MATQPYIPQGYTLERRAEFLERQLGLILRRVNLPVDADGITVAKAMKELKWLGYSHKEAAGMVLGALGFKVKK